MSKHWSPYQDNGGSFAAIGGDDFAAFSIDTRLASGYSIASRLATKWAQLTKSVVYVAVGMQADADMLLNHIQTEIVQYKFDHKAEPSFEALRQLVSTVLYSKRFFPYYAFVGLCGLNTKGEGVVVAYDAVGSPSVTKDATAGDAGQMIQAMIDNRLRPQHQQHPQAPLRTADEVAEFLQQCWVAAADRDITVGDFLDLGVVTAEGITTRRVDLRKD